MKKKDNALGDFMNMTRKSWTWSRLTEQERDRFIKVLYGSEIFGTWEQRYKQLHNIYAAFLMGLDYRPIGWREPKTVPTF